MNFSGEQLNKLGYVHTERYTTEERLTRRAKQYVPAGAMVHKVDTEESLVVFKNGMSTIEVVFKGGNTEVVTLVDGECQDWRVYKTKKYKML